MVACAREKHVDIERVCKTIADKMMPIWEFMYRKVLLRSYLSLSSSLETS